LHSQKLNNEARSSRDDIWRYFSEGAVVYGHDFQLGTESQFEGESLQVTVVVDVQRLQVFQAANFLWQRRQPVLAHAQIRQLGQLPYGPWQLCQVIGLQDQLL